MSLADLRERAAFWYPYTDEETEIPRVRRLRFARGEEAVHVVR